MNSTRRRRFLIAGLCLSVAGAPAVAQSSQKTWRIGFLSASFQRSGAAADFLQGMRELGYIEGKHFAMEWRFAEENLERLHGLAADMQQTGVDVIVAVSSYSVVAARKAAPNTPIVMTNVGNPVASGFVASLSRPGGNITGLTNVSTAIGGKYLELLHSAVPKLTSVAVLIDPAHPNHPATLKQIEAAAKALRVRVIPIMVSDPERIDDVLHILAKERPRALIVPTSPFWARMSQRVAEAALKSSLPTVFGNLPAVVEANGLLGFEPNRAEIGRRAAALVEKIFKGAKPADLPVELPTRFDLTVNTKTAKALGITIPQSVLLQASRVIE
jgi:putative tryptophan/tyrosine transport system substrate-binding protein